MLSFEHRLHHAHLRTWLFTSYETQLSYTKPHLTIKQNGNKSNIVNTFGETTFISSFKKRYFPNSFLKFSPQFLTQASKTDKARSASFSCGDWILWASNLVLVWALQSKKTNESMGKPRHQTFCRHCYDCLQNITYFHVSPTSKNQQKKFHGAECTVPWNHFFQ